jgi:hypothetical protein
MSGRLLSLLSLALLVPATAVASTAGAGYTTVDPAYSSEDGSFHGCWDSPNGVNCNHYVAKDAVFMSGGPDKGGFSLEDGTYFFAVLTPGSQNGGFIDGAEGNLSDIVACGTDGGDCIEDDVSNRTFTVTDHEVSYTGTHHVATGPSERPIIGLDPFDDTDNPGGVYILAICQTGATSPSQCKYDAFKVDEAEEPPEFGAIEGMKYYDANANGQYDDGEVGIADWEINLHDGISEILYTDEDGYFQTSLTEDIYYLYESTGGGTWMQTGNRYDQWGKTGDASVTLEDDMSYTVDIADEESVDGLYFGNLCVGAGGGLTLGFWSNKNGKAIMDSTATYLFLDGLNLRKANGAAFDPTAYAGYRSWLLGATATNMAYMLSAQLTAMELNVRFEYVDGGALIYAPGTDSANINGFATVDEIMAEANTSLGLYGLTVAPSDVRDYQEALKDALDDANNNRTFVQAGPDACPAPVF